MTTKLGVCGRKWRHCLERGRMMLEKEKDKFTHSPQETAGRTQGTEENNPRKEGRNRTRAAWVAQLVECLTLHFSSGQDPGP